MSTHNWVVREDKGKEAADSGSDLREAVECIVSVFRAPLEAKKFSAEVIQDELEEVVTYVRQYLPIATDPYKKVWYTLHTCLDASKWPNIFMLCQLIFSLPFSTSRVEQIFSQLKLIKTNRTTNLHNDTLHALLEICIERPSLMDFNADLAIYLWWKSCVLLYYLIVGINCTCCKIFSKL